jgi:hypothetical protein
MRFKWWEAHAPPRASPDNVFFRPDSTRVLVRPFIPADPTRVANIIGRGLSLNESECQRELVGIEEDFAARHLDIHAVWRRNFELVKKHISGEAQLSETRQLYIGALFSGEYALESAALFNPSIVPHPDQSALARGRPSFHPQFAGHRRGAHLVDRVS